MLADLLDISIVALLFYSLLLLMRREKYAMMLYGLLIASGLYIAARGLNLDLTLRILQYFAGVALIVIVIIFQSEIRKYFELLGLLGTRKILFRPGLTATTDISEIIRACAKLANSKIGALIVFQGRDSLDTYATGGIILDGAISEELILSLFDPHSEGHDGAVIVNNNRIQKFSTQLPLSDNFREIGKHGTRHSAALGLSERADALCIVVSEELATISVCRNGRLKTLENIIDLEKELDKYLHSKFSFKSENILVRAVIHNFWLKLASAIIAVGLWLTV